MMKEYFDGSSSVLLYLAISLEIIAIPHHSPLKPALSPLPGGR
jgi:hypothetical protein